MRLADSFRFRARPRLGFVLLLSLVALPASTFAAASPECKKALESYDSEYATRSDAGAWSATEGLETSCRTPYELALVVSRRGMIEYQRKNIGAAVTLFEQSVRLNPENTTFRMSLCGMYTEAARYIDAIGACEGGLKLAKEQDDGSVEKHGMVLSIGFNLALAKTRRRVFVCKDSSIYEMFDAYREANPKFAWVYQLLGAWVWDCDKNFEKGLALYKKSCELGHRPACEQVAYTEACQCRERQGDS